MTATFAGIVRGCRSYGWASGLGVIMLEVAADIELPDLPVVLPLGTVQRDDGLLIARAVEVAGESRLCRDLAAALRDQAVTVTIDSAGLATFTPMEGEQSNMDAVRVNTATIVVRDTGPTGPDLSMFPFLPGQYFEPGAADNPDGDGLLVTLQMVDHADLTAAQEQYLNTHDAVIAYNVDQSIEDGMAEYTVSVVVAALGYNSRAVAKMLNDAGAQPRIDEEAPDLTAAVDRATLATLYAQRARMREAGKIAALLRS